MSWSFNAIGQTDKLIEAIDEYAASLTGQSRVEFDAVAPAIKGVLENNFNRRPTGLPCVMQIEASGHGSATAEEQIDRTCSLSVKPLYTRLV